MKTEKLDKILRNQVMLFNLVSALIYRITGEIPHFILELNSKEKVLVEPDLSLISYQGVDLQSVGQPSKESDRRVLPSSVCHAN